MHDDEHGPILITTDDAGTIRIRIPNRVKAFSPEEALAFAATLMERVTAAERRRQEATREDIADAVHEAVGAAVLRRAGEDARARGSWWLADG